MIIKLNNITHLDVRDNELDDSLLMNLSEGNPDGDIKVKSLDISHNQLQNFSTVQRFLSLSPALTNIDIRKVSYSNLDKDFYRLIAFKTSENKKTQVNSIEDTFYNTSN